jgi:hypothetical protein
MTVFPKARSVTQANMIAGRNEPEERRVMVKGVVKGTVTGVMGNRADRSIFIPAEQRVRGHDTDRLLEPPAPKHAA